jgi:hypothetical protein
VLGLLDPHRRDTQTVEDRVEAGHSLSDRGQVEEVGHDDLLELGSTARHRSPSDDEHALDSLIEEALAQHALADHAGGAEEDDLHVTRVQPLRSGSRM